MGRRPRPRLANGGGRRAGRRVTRRAGGAGPAERAAGPPPWRPRGRAGAPGGAAGPLRAVSAGHGGAAGWGCRAGEARGRRGAVRRAAREARRRTPPGYRGRRAVVSGGPAGGAPRTLRARGAARSPVEPPGGPLRAEVPPPGPCPGRRAAPGGSAEPGPAGVRGRAVCVGCARRRAGSCEPGGAAAGRNTGPRRARSAARPRARGRAGTRRGMARSAERAGGAGSAGPCAPSVPGLADAGPSARPGVARSAGLRLPPRCSRGCRAPLPSRCSLHGI